MKKFKWARFFTYLSVGLMLFGGWGYVNYMNYEVSQQEAQVQINENNVMIDEEIDHINMEQNQLRQVQMVWSEPPAPMYAPLMSKSAPSGAVNKSVSRAPANADPMYNELQERIDELEAEKIEYKEEKGRIASEIEDVMSLFTVDIKNPMINIVLLPVFGYGLRRFLKLIFDKLEEKFLHHETE